MNKNTIEGKWNEIVGEAQKVWGTLTNDDVERAKGNAKVLVGIIKQKVGKTQEDVESKFSNILHKFNITYENSAINPSENKTHEKETQRKNA